MALSSSDQAVLDRAVDFLQSEVKPRAQEIDQDPEALKRALDGLCSQELLALRRPPEFGGPGISEDAFRAFQEACARASGTLSFLQTQHQSAGSLLAKCPSAALKEEYLPYMANGGKLLGIGFSQLRRVGPPIMRAEPVAGGYQLEGEVPWVTGLGFFHEFIAGASLPDGRAVFGVVPFEDVDGLRYSAPMKLAAMEAANTVSARFSAYHLADPKVLFIQPIDWIKNNDQINIALQGHFALGCAQAGIDVVREAGQRRGSDFTLAAAADLEAELSRCRAAMLGARSASELTTVERLDARAWAIELAVRCAHSAVTASSGAANALSHPAQRIYREALVYTVSAQTTDIMEATLKRLTRPQAP